MAEQFTQISQARQNLPELAKSAQKQMTRYVITHQGLPQAVLLGYDDYQGILAATQLAQRPELVRNAEQGFADIAGGKYSSLQSAARRLKKAAKARAAEPVGEEKPTLPG